MPTTSNFGWTTPADTDLVKDGASAIRTLGNGIDSSFVDLKGGTTGQVLSKASNTDLDFSWVAQDDSNAIQNALLTTTGDTIYASSASTPARLGIGSSGQVLTVSGGVPTWATPASAGALTQLATGSLTGSSVSITSISSSYTHLQLWLYEMSANNNGAFQLRFNSDTGSNYYTIQTMSGSTANYNFGNSTVINLQTEGNVGTDTKGTNVLNIYFYASSASRKLVDGVYFGNRNTVGLRVGNLAGCWDSTSAITSIQVQPESGNSFDNGTYYLYGVK
jgi:hypothetical protein